MIEPQGLRYNSGKPKTHLVDPVLEECVAQVLEFGAQKYDEQNWRKGLSFANCISSLDRHVKDLKRGLLVDDESGLPLEGHIACNCMFLLWFKKHGVGIDDVFDQQHFLRMFHNIPAVEENSNSTDHLQHVEEGDG